jgi:hypothetical protein
MDLNGFDASTVEDRQSFDPLPNGEYTAVITESEAKPTKAGTGTRLNFTFEVVDGEFKGRKLWAGINYLNPNPVAQEIGERELAEICKAVNVTQPPDTNALHGIPLTIKVAVVNDDYRGGMKNEIKAYKPLGTAADTGGVTGSPKAAGVPWAK